MNASTKDIQALAPLQPKPIALIVGIEHESYEETGTHLRGHIPTNHSGPFATLLKV